MSIRALITAGRGSVPVSTQDGALMSNGNDPRLRRAGDPQDHLAERDALPGERHGLDAGATAA